MATINAYLSFNGTCEAAFNFYRSVFGGEFSYIGRFKDMPSPTHKIPDAEKDKIMHIGLPISKETMLLGCDMSEEMMGQKHAIGNNFALCITPENEAEAVRIFESLSAGGEITMPMEQTFWGSLFGMFTDKFGVSWMVDYQLKSSK